MRWVNRFLTALLLGTLVFLTFVSPAFAQQMAQRLILKDGSYQPVTKWERKGDRVRYLSAERNEWEELPNDLVDWDATEKFAKDRAAGVPDPEARKLDEELAAERDAEGPRTPQVVPGLHLPEDSGVLLLDTFQNQPQLVKIEQSAGELNRNRKENILRAAVIPIASGKQTVELPGQHAIVQAHVTLPSIYVDTSLPPDYNPPLQPLGAQPAQKPQQPQAQQPHQPEQPHQPQQPQQPEQAWDRFHIVRVQVKSGKRIVGVIKINPLGKTSQEENLVPTSTQRLTGGWVKVTPVAALQPGEYAVVELLGREGMNTYVWDFGVNPAAVANAGALKPEATVKAPDPAKQTATPRQ
jgi:hypothetical protein